jgi:hypothetical protein
MWSTFIFLTFSLYFCMCMKESCMHSRPSDQVSAINQYPKELHVDRALFSCSPWWICVFVNTVNSCGFHNVWRCDHMEVNIIGVVDRYHWIGMLCNFDCTLKVCVWILIALNQRKYYKTVFPKNKSSPFSSSSKFLLKIKHFSWGNCSCCRIFVFTLIAFILVP